VFKRDSIIKLQQFIVIPWIQCNMLTYRASQNTLIQSMFIIVSVTMKLIYIKIQFTNVVHISSAFINRRVQFSNVVNISSAFINRRVQFSNVVNISSAFINRRVQFSNVVHISSAFINRRVQFSNVVHTNDGLEYNVKLLTNTNITSRSVIHVCPYCIHHIWDRLNCFKVNKIENICVT